MKPVPALFTVDDVNSCAWGANCGPGALAGVLGLTLDQVRPHMGDFERKHYTNPRLMFSALKSLKQEYQLLKSLWPRRGLVRVQWWGPWTAPEANPRARLRHTHWIGVDSTSPGELWIFDINCTCIGGWVPFTEWRDRVVPWLLREVEPSANGAWHATHILDLKPR